MDRWSLDRQILRYRHDDDHRDKDGEVQRRITVIQVIEYTLMYVLNEDENVSHEHVMVEDTVHTPPSVVNVDAYYHSRDDVGHNEEDDEQYMLNNNFTPGSTNTTADTTEHLNWKIDGDASRPWWWRVPGGEVLLVEGEEYDPGW